MFSRALPVFARLEDLPVPTVAADPMEWTGLIEGSVRDRSA
jgi:hypothetical protein